MDRTGRVLVGYATAAGSTQAIAERIADVLTSAGLTVVCRPVGPDLEPAAFDAVVLGSAVHNMAWLSPAVDFLSRFPAGDAPALWCFSVEGLSHPDRTRFSRWLAGSELQKVEQRFPGGHRPRDHRMFAGIVDLRQVPLWGRSSSGRPGDAPVTSGTGRPSRRGRARSRTGSTHSARLPEAIRHDPVGRSPARALFGPAPRRVHAHIAVTEWD